jgi:tRNA modification GTPase
MMISNTIFAVSSGSGRAGITVVRVSGDQAREALVALVGAVPAARKLVVRQVCDPVSGEVVDEAMVVWLPGPNSATGEDVAEFHLHGSVAVVRSVLSILGQMDGLRVAEAGEFTRRAFRNGKLDLIEVEGLADLIDAETEGQRRLAMRQLTGEASLMFVDWHRQVLEMLAILEASIDFADDDQTVEQSLSAVSAKVQALVGSLERALEQSERASLVRQGFRIVIAGPPNAGKSSLLNALVGRQAALVSPLAGTTRDVVEAGLVIEGVPVTLSDTAGLRVAAGDPVEEMGIARSRQEIADADILIWVVSQDTDRLFVPPREADLVVESKADLFPHESSHRRNIRVSAVSGEGLPGLRTKLAALIQAKSDVGESAVLVRARHRQAIIDSIRMLNESVNTSNAALEVQAESMRQAARALESLTGRVDVEDVLGQIFSQFCIGK